MSPSTDLDLSLNTLFRQFQTLTDQTDPKPQNPNETPQEHQEHEFHLKSISATITIRSIDSLGLSFQLWPAATALLSLLSSSPSLLHPSRPRRVLELGSGTGVVGIAFAAAFSSFVTLSDLPHVLPNLSSNAALNESLVRARGGEVEVRRLVWGDEEDLEGVKGESFDLVVGSDLVYCGETAGALVRTVERVVGEKGVFVMAHLRRWRRKEGVFWRKIRRGFEVEVLWREQEEGRGGVVVYRFVRKKKEKEKEKKCGALVFCTRLCGFGFAKAIQISQLFLLLLAVNFVISKRAFKKLAKEITPQEKKRKEKKRL